MTDAVNKSVFLADILHEKVHAEVAADFFKDSGSQSAVKGVKERAGKDRPADAVCSREEKFVGEAFQCHGKNDKCNDTKKEGLHFYLKPAFK